MAASTSRNHPASEQPPGVGILGIGNLLLRDEGFGVHCIGRLRERYRFPEQVRLLDGGTAGIMLAPFIEAQDVLFVVDVVALDGEPGTVHRFTDKDIRSGAMNPRMSPHQLGLLEILELCRLRGKVPERVEMITVIPKDLTTGIGLSPELSQSLDLVESHLLAALEEQGMGPLERLDA